MYFEQRLIHAEPQIAHFLPPDTGDYEWQIKHKKGCPMAAKQDPGRNVRCQCKPDIFFARFFTPIAQVDVDGNVKMLLTSLQIADLERPEEWKGSCLQKPSD